MKKTLLAISMAVLAVPLTSQANTGLELSGNFGLTSNYKFRGISQTDNKPAAQGGFDLNHGSGLYLGVWTSNVSNWAKFEGNGQEVDIYAGYSTELPMGLGFDIGALQYVYPGTLVGDSGKKPNTLEFYVGLSFGPISYKFSQTSDLWFSVAGSKNSTYHHISAEFPLSEKASVTAAFGEQTVKGVGNPTYNDYSIGVSYALPSDFSVTLAYVGTSGLSPAEKGSFTAGPTDDMKLYDAKAILTISKSF